MVRISLLTPESIPETELTYVVIGARYRQQWVFVRHRERLTWEMPAGHIEEGETAFQAAIRELREETGTLRSSLRIICDYEVWVAQRRECGRLYAAEILEMEEGLDHEIAEVRLAHSLPSDLTYPEVQKVLFEQAQQELRS
jgi:8-oxo-dGTP diphosphatase